MIEKRNEETLANRVCKAINNREVVMRPRWHFVLRAGLIAFGFVLVALALLYIVSFIIFMERLSGAGFAPVLGARGWFVFFRTLPWLLVLVAAVFIVILEILVRRYSFAYRRPLLYSAAGIVFLTFIGGFVIAHTSFHPRLLERASGPMPFFGARLYRYADEREVREIYRGLVVATTSEGFVIMNRRGATTSVMLASSTVEFPFPIMLGAPVTVFGEEEKGVIEAAAVRPGMMRPMRWSHMK